MSKALFKSTSLVSLMTFISRVLGFLRDMIAAQIFGVNASVDAFLVAFKLPNFMRNLFAEGSFSQAFVPTLSQYKQTKSPEETRLFISHVAGCLSVILFLVCLIGVVFMPIIVKITAPGFEPYRFQLATYLSRVTFPYLMLISLAAFTGSILNTFGKFGVAAFTPALLNVVLIVAALYCSHWFAVPIESQAWAIIIAGILQLFFQLPYLKKIGLLVKPTINWQDEGVKRILRLMLPALFGSSIVQIGILINQIYASFLTVGSVTWLYYSERLAYFPQGVFGVALATVVLPHLSSQYAKKSHEGFISAMDWGIRCNLLIGLPAAITMGILAGPLVCTLFQYGRFHAYDVIMTRQSVIAYAIGLLAFMLVKILSTGFYARQDIRTPVKIGIAAVLFNIVMNTALIGPFKHAGLALATSLSSCFNVIILLYFLYRKNIYRFQPGWGIFVLRLLFANGIVVFWLIWQQGKLLNWLQWSTHQRAFHLAYLLGIAMVLYFFSLWLSGLRLKHMRALS
jgi:putative peptidoglycan lipid II flippase